MSGQRRFTSFLTLFLMVLTQSGGPVLARQPVSGRKASAAAPVTPVAATPAKPRPQWSPALERVKQQLLEQLRSGTVTPPSAPAQAGAMPEVIPPALPAGEVPLSHSFEYDAKGNLTKRVDANGNVILQTYDELDRLVRIDYPDGTFVEYTYDVNGNRTSMTDATGTTDYEFDELDRLTGVTYPDARLLAIEYDFLSRITYMTYPDGSWVDYDHWNDGTIKTIRTRHGTTRIDYDDVGRIEQRQLANGDKTLYEYDDYGRLEQIRHEAPGGQLISQFDYTLDKYGNRTRIDKTTPNGVETMTAEYDHMDRLTRVVYPDGREVVYEFDDFNNRTSKTEDDGETITVTTYEYDSNNRLLRTRINGNIDEEFTYDGNGNMTARKRFGHITHYEWDYENRLTAVIKPSGERVEYSYNGEDNLWQREVNYLVGARTTNFYTTDSPDMPMMLNEYTQETGRWAAHVYADDTLIESEVREGGGSAYAAYLTGDYNAASIAELRDQLGNSLFSLDYPDVYGPANPKVIVGALAPGYISEFYDPDAHLQFLRARWYDPALGIFLSQDMTDGDVKDPYSHVNRYAYGALNPLRFVDRDGLKLYDAQFWSGTLDVGLFAAAVAATVLTGGAAAPLLVYTGANALYGAGKMVASARDQEIDRNIGAAAGRLIGGETGAEIGEFGWDLLGLGLSVKSAANTIMSIRRYDSAGRSLARSYGIMRSSSDYFNAGTKLKHGYIFGYEMYSIGETSLGATTQALEWSNPGGVRLNKSATAYLDIGKIVGATYDPDTGQIVLYGEEDKARLPGMDMADLAMAIRMVFDHGVAPEVSLDPPVDCGSGYHQWRYGPPDRPDLMNDTHLGWVMMEADRVLKYLSLGRNPWNTDEELPVGFIPGYRSYVDFLGDYPCSSGTQRFWIHPDEILIEESPDGGAVKLVYASMMLSTEEVLEARSSNGPLAGDANRDGKVTSDDLWWVRSQLGRPVTDSNYRADANSDGVINGKDFAVVWKNLGRTIGSRQGGSGDPAADDFVAWFNTHWQELRDYDFTKLGAPNDDNIFQEVEALAKVYGVVKWIQDYNIPFDTSWVSTYDVYYTENDTPPCNPTMNVKGPCGGGNVIVTGGVALCKALTINGVSVPPPVLSQRPGESTMGWTFVDPVDNKEYNAAGISAARRYKDGVASRSETDLSVDGRAGKLELIRTYSSFDALDHPSRWIWEPTMIRPKGRAMDQITCILDDNGNEIEVVVLAPAGVYLVDRARTSEFRFAGLYCSHFGAEGCPEPHDPGDVDPQGIMDYFDEFDPNTDVIGYFDAGLLGEPRFFFKDGTIYADFPSLESGDHEGPRSGWLFKNRTNDSWSFFNPDGKLLRVKDSHDNQTNYTRDGGRLASISDGKATINLTYSGDQVIAADASNGTSVSYCYDIDPVDPVDCESDYFLTRSQLDTGQQIHYYYDADGLLNDVRDENGVSLVGTTNDVYGRAGSTELLGFTDPFTRDFNLDSGITEESGPLGDWTTQYNQDYLPTRVVDPLGHETEMIWNDYKLLITRIEGVGTLNEARTDYYYVSTGDLLAMRRPNGEVEITLPNSDGRPETTLFLDTCTTFLDGNFDAQHIYTGDAGGNLDCYNLSDYFDYEYSPTGKLKRKTATQMGFDVESYTYDAQGRMLTSEDGESHRLTYSYDGGSLARISTITNDLGEYVDYTYDDRDRLATVTNGILPVHYEYDGRDRVKAVVHGEPGDYGAPPEVRHRTEYNFDPVYGILLSVRSPNEVVTAYTYNARKLLEQIAHDGRVIYEYQYDGAGRVTQISFQGTVGGALQLEKGWFYDADADAFIDEADLDWFATGWLKDIDDPTIQYPPNARFGLTYDYDLDGFVGPDDFSFFSTGWMRASDDPAIVSPPVALAH